MTPESTNTRPSKALRAFIRDNLATVNSIVISTGFLLSLMDFLVPRTEAITRAIYSATAVLTVIVVMSAIFPSMVDRFFSFLGFRNLAVIRMPMWKHPSWLLAAFLLVTFSLVGFLSVARASKGGILASEIPAVRTFQTEVLSLHREVADVKAGVDSANAKLDLLVLDSADPQKEIVARGYLHSDNGVMKAIKNGDVHVLSLFVRSQKRITQQGPLSVLLNGDQPWNQEVADTLTRDMFQGGKACSSRFYMDEIKPPAAQRVAAYKRLCDSQKAVDDIRRYLDDERTKPSPGVYFEKLRQVLPVNLRLLLS